MVVALVYALGFALFVSLLPAPADVRSDVRPEADGVVVLTGGGPRLEAGVALFEKGVGKRLLISGVGLATSRDTLKDMTHGGKRFDCCADIDYAASALAAAHSGQHAADNFAEA